jgi:pimeloyl-ACP methyl ester carboxylesterase
LDTFQSSARAVRALLMGVVGDAVALVTDRAIRATLVERVERDLDWLATRCKSVLIVGHSQGAMLAYLAARTRPNNVKRLLTLGSGFRALQTLIDGIETRFPSIPDCFAIAQVAAAGVLAAAASALDAGWGCPGARRVMFHARDLYWNLWHRFPFSYSGGTQRCGGILACTDGGREFCLVRCDSQSRPRSRPR